MKMMAFQMMKLKEKELLTWKRNCTPTNIMPILLLLWKEKILM
uniref:Alternative protein KDM2A n=1 Tax=Homo sapiens TaxID=9606 RepID=L0R5B6_HUMAN|nr:alternative protein KDM2A [Homo sapiens]